MGTLDFLHESKALTLNPSPIFGRGTFKLAPLLPKMREGVGGCSKIPQGGQILYLCKRLHELRSQETMKISFPRASCLVVEFRLRSTAA